MSSIATERPSKREAEVLALLQLRLTNAEIAERLFISVRTVESHVSSLLRKYGVADRFDLTALARPAAGDSTTPGGRMSGLPDPRTAFVGREREREAVLAALAHRRLVTLLGPGGVGKTRLAGAVGAAAAPTFPLGGVFVDLVPVRDDFVVQAVATALGVTEQVQQPLLAAITDRLGRGRTLLVLDNCEHLLDPVAGLVERILSACPEVTVLATSRERLAVPGEQVVPVGPLPLGTDAVTLFHDRARAADPEFDGDPAVVAELCARLDGMPLAIELAAARSASLGAAGLLAALDDVLLLLAGGRAADRRHRSLRAVVGWSHDLLDDDERLLLRRLAVFVGSFDLPAAVAVTDVGAPGAVADLLGRLADKSLLVPERGAVSRWRLLDTVRAFAAERLTAAGEEPALRERHLCWAAETAVALRGHPADRCREEFRAVADDLRAALTNCPPGPSPLAHQLARALGHLAYVHRFLLEAAAHFERAAAHAPAPGDAVPDLRHAADCIVTATNCSPQAFRHLLAAAEGARAAGDGDARALALTRAVELANRFNAEPAAEIPQQRLRELLGQATAAGTVGKPTVAAGLTLANAWTASGRCDPDPRLAAAALAAARAAGDPVLISASLDAVGGAAGRAGRLREAHRVTGERIALLPELSRDDPSAGVEIVDAVHMAATWAIAAGDLPAALAAAERVYRDDLVSNHPYASASKLIPALALTGRFNEALRHTEAMWAGWCRAGRPAAPWLWLAVLAAALACGLLGDGERFGLWRARALEVTGLAAPEQVPNFVAFLAFVDARVAVHTPRTDAAAALVMRVFGSESQGRYGPYARAAAAELAVVAGLPDGADRLAAAAPDGAENDWAAACLRRAAGRLHHDEDALAASIRAWERIDARFERACTLLLLPERAAEGRAELVELTRR
ncbi:LuxR C-terminal-related transcriptional regulator [Micromonospora sp. NPDC005305]|uniref:ATP-binding protein n=1 Tax=Micromonospora sp. NPDC005305 TaxID=3156875 RepID=UPI0033AE98F5